MKKKGIRILLVILVLLVLAAAYTFLLPLDGKVRAFSAPVSEGYTGDFEKNDALGSLGRIDLGGYEQPETVLYRDGYLYSYCHGKLIRTASDGSGTELLLDAGDGETLGFDFDAAGNIIFCDVRCGGTTPGIYKADLSGDTVTVTALCTEVEGEQLRCPDALAVAQNGIIYFSEATEFSPVQYKNATYAFEYECYYHSSHGKVCAYDPATGEAWVVASGFSGANGIALSFDEQYLYLSETMEYSIWRIPVTARHAEKGNGAELFLSNLPGCVDNLNRGLDGRYWVGLVSPRDASWDKMLGNVPLRILLLRYSKIPDTSDRAAAPETGTASVFAFDDAGNIRAFLMAEDSPYFSVTGATETEDRLYLHGNNYTGYIAYTELPA